MPVPELLAHGEQLVDLREILFHARRARPGGESEPEVLVDRELREQPATLRDERDPAPRDCLRGPPAKRPLAEQDVAGARRDESHDRVQGGGLAGAVRADETDDLARRDLQRHAAYGGDASVRDLEIANE